MEDKACEACGDRYPADYMKDGRCIFCRQKETFGAFARECGLDRFPDPTGERYVYGADGSFAGKKSENADFISALWNALVRAKGGSKDLLIGEE